MAQPGGFYPQSLKNLRVNAEAFKRVLDLTSKEGGKTIYLIFLMSMKSYQFSYLKKF